MAGKSAVEVDKHVELGHLLRETREMLGLTLEEIENNIHIRSHHLDSLERGSLEDLPSPVQRRGFLHNYAEFLGLEPDEILLLYAEAVQNSNTGYPKSGETARVRPRSTKAVTTPLWLNSDLILTVVMVVFLAAAVVWGGSRILEAASMEDGREQAAAVAVDVDEALETPTIEPTATEPAGGSISLVLLTPSETATLPLVMNTTSGVGITVVVERQTWLRVLVDGEERTAGRLSPGDVLEFRGEETVEVTAGNAGGVRIFFRGDDLGLMGDLDQAVIRIWTPDGVITPTPLATNTPTITPSPSPAPTGTSTSVVQAD
jgi:cytoskeleton protein RodZ